MKITLTKWQRDTLHKICKTIPGGTLGQIEQDMRVMKALKISDKDRVTIFLKDYYSTTDYEQLDKLLAKIGISLHSLATLEVINDKVADQKTELDLTKSDIERLIKIAFQGTGYPKNERTLQLKDTLEKLENELKESE